MNAREAATGEPSALVGAGPNHGHETGCAMTLGREQQIAAVVAHETERVQNLIENGNLSLERLVGMYGNAVRRHAEGLTDDQLAAEYRAAGELPDAAESDAELPEQGRLRLANRYRVLGTAYEWLQAEYGEVLDDCDEWCRLGRYGYLHIYRDGGDRPVRVSVFRRRNDGQGAWTMDCSREIAVLVASEKELYVAWYPELAGEEAEPVINGLRYSQLVRAYEMHGMSGPEDLCAKHGITDYAACDPCETETPTFDGVCAVCGTAR